MSSLDIIPVSHKLIRKQGQDPPGHGIVFSDKVGAHVGDTKDSTLLRVA